MAKLPIHYQETVLVSTLPKTLFDFVDDHRNLSSHMSKSSWMMGGGQMTTEIDEGKGQKVGSHIKLSGKAFGFEIKLDEVVTKHLSPYSKAWETVEYPQLIVIGNYRMGFKIEPEGSSSKLTVYIDYELPRSKSGWLGILFGKFYAKWCVRQMLTSARQLS